MNIIDSYISVPYKKYHISANSSAAVRLTVLEWFVLRTIKQYKNTESETKTFEYFWMDILNMESNNKMLYSAVKYVAVANLLIKIDKPYDEYTVHELTPQDCTLTELGETVLKQEYTAGQATDREETICYDITTNTLKETFNDYSSHDHYFSAKKITQDNPFKVDYPEQLIKDALNSGSLLNYKYKKLSRIVNATELIDDEDAWRTDKLTLSTDSDGKLICNYPLTEAVINALDDALISHICTDDSSKEMNLAEIPTGAYFGRNIIREISHLIDYSDYVFINSNCFESIKKKEKKLLSGRTCFIYGTNKFSIEEDDFTEIYLPIPLFDDDVAVVLHNGEMLKTGICYADLNERQMKIEFAYPGRTGDDVAGLVKKQMLKSLDEYPEMLSLFSTPLFESENFVLSDQISQILGNMETAREKAMFLQLLDRSCKKLHIHDLDISQYGADIADSIDEETADALGEAVIGINSDYFKGNTDMLQNLLIWAAKKVHSDKKIWDINNVLSLYLTHSSQNIKQFCDKADEAIKPIIEAVDLDSFFDVFNDRIPEEIPTLLSVNNLYNALAKAMLDIDSKLGGFNWYTDNNAEDLAQRIVDCEELKDVKTAADIMEKVISALHEEGCSLFNIDSDKDNIASKLDALQNLLCCFVYPSGDTADIYIIDTNVFIHKPTVLDHFNESQIIRIPLTVINELDNLKDYGDEDTKRAARTATKEIEKRDQADKNSGNLHFLIESREYSELIPKDFSDKKHDNLIMATALTYKLYHPVIITDDVNFRNIVRTQGIDAYSLDNFLNKNGDVVESAPKREKADIDIKAVLYQTAKSKNNDSKGENIEKQKTPSSVVIEAPKSDYTMSKKEYYDFLNNKVDLLSNAPYQLKKKNITLLKQYGIDTISKLVTISSGELSRKIKASTIRREIQECIKKLHSISVDKDDGNEKENDSTETSDDNSALYTGELREETKTLGTKIILIAEKNYGFDENKMSSSELLKKHLGELMSQIGTEKPLLKMELEAEDTFTGKINILKQNLE